MDVRHYSTSDFIAGARVAGWSDIAARVFARVEVQAFSPKDFHGTIDSIQLGDVCLSNVQASPAKIIRSAKDASYSREQRYFIHMQFEGELSVSQLGREARLKEGDLAMSDTALPYELEYEEPSSTLVLAVPPKEIKRRLPAPEIALAQRLDGQTGLSSILSVMLARVWKQAQAGLDEDIGRRLGSSLLDLFAISCMDAFGDRAADSAIASFRRSQICCYIESHLKDPDLSVSSIAAAFRISPRYLHMLFTDENETISGYIRRRRLEECRKTLADPVWARRSITEIAYTFGFNNTTHFARVFRDHYNVRPRDYRKSCLERQGKSLSVK